MQGTCAHEAWTEIAYLETRIIAMGGGSGVPEIFNRPPIADPQLAGGHMLSHPKIGYMKSG